jgi:hypothetical protein
MTLARCKESFIELLTDPENRVVALSGKWGTGKSHLWSEVQAASGDASIKSAIYVSLFGVSTLSDLKLKLAQNVVRTLKENSVLTDALTKGYDGFKKVLQGIHKGFSALDDLSLIAVPLMIKDRFIVIDDIERKHDRLTIDEILGFIDDAIQNLGCRILLVLNSDQLKDKQLWDLFREKVIDQELCLDTSASEAFDIAVSLTPSTYSSYIKAAVESCRVTNIRIVRKIIRVVNRLLANRGELHPDVLSRTVPSATLLSAIHYKGLEDGPDFDFVLQFNTFLIARHTKDPNKKGDPPSTEDKSRERWRLLLDSLGVRGVDEFEELVVDYLRSGLVEGAAIGKIIDRYAVEWRELGVRKSLQDFFERCMWNPEVSEAELLDEVRALLPDVNLLDAYSVTALHDQAVTFPGGTDVGRQLIEGWLFAFRARYPPGSEHGFDPDFNSFRRPVHPDIAAEIRTMQAQTQSRTTLLEVCRKVHIDHGWGTREELLMRSATPALYEQAIRAATGADLKLLLLQSADFLKNRRTWTETFGDAPQSFLSACRIIAQDSNAARLGRLIRDVFRDAGMGSELDIAVLPRETPSIAEEDALSEAGEP